ncbi:MAG TPA: ankyrin repeat domain-containing protein [Candidatus Goldiibacteriota bacterium]|nr:ankyrin repeat domain-containing protein [Candidatus Goldiibacteriota bacterium]HPN64195.1 ankyrin repeat domain-containing protein [Candidatus Goldiibacteriota bacterium]HRQ43662.1 ankyrin repeat domain-containing protein [Candidatus Goldiibacteriota bacterium]
MTEDEKLITAAEKGDLDAVKDAVKNGAEFFNVAMLKAAGQGNLDVIKYLLRRGANNVPDALKMAASSGREDAVKYLLGKADSGLNTAVMEALKSGHENTAAMMLKSGAGSFHELLSFAYDNSDLALYTDVKEKAGRQFTVILKQVLSERFNGLNRRLADEKLEAFINNDDEVKMTAVLDAGFDPNYVLLFRQNIKAPLILCALAAGSLKAGAAVLKHKPDICLKGVIYLNEEEKELSILDLQNAQNEPLFGQVLLRGYSGLVKEEPLKVFESAVTGCNEPVLDKIMRNKKFLKKAGGDFITFAILLKKRALAGQLMQNGAGFTDSEFYTKEQYAAIAMLADNNDTVMLYALNSAGLTKRRVKYDVKNSWEIPLVKAAFDRNYRVLSVLVKCFFDPYEKISGEATPLSYCLANGADPKAISILKQRAGKRVKIN